MGKNFFIGNGISKLSGGSYDINSIISAIETITDWALRIGITAAGLALVIGFALYSVVDVDRKQQVKHGIIQTMFGIVGIIIAVSIVNLIIGLF